MRGLVVSVGACALVWRADMDMVSRLVVYAGMCACVFVCNAWKRGGALRACARSCPLVCPSFVIRTCMRVGVIGVDESICLLFNLLVCAQQQQLSPQIGELALGVAGLSMD